MKKLSKRVLSLVLSLVILASLCTVVLTANAADGGMVFFKNTAQLTFHQVTTALSSITVALRQMTLIFLVLTTSMTTQQVLGLSTLLVQRLLLSMYQRKTVLLSRLILLMLLSQ